MADEIKVTHKTITVAGRKLQVWKATFEAQLKRFTLIEEAEKSLNGTEPGEGIEAMVRRGFHKMTYPSLIACTTGKVFSEDECYHVENDELELWLATARELNPLWFPTAENVADAAEEVIEKKSTPD